MSGGGYLLKDRRVFVAGHTGLLGSALVRRLASEDCDILTVLRSALDLRDQRAVVQWMKEARPNAVFVAAARVGGIMGNLDRPAEFLYDNLTIAANIIHAAHLCETERLLFLASSAVYPVTAAQPLREHALMTGPVDPAHEGYAIAKIAGIKLCETYRRQYGRDYIAALPTNLYGPADNFDPRASHVLPALIRKVHEAKLANADCVTIWGSGTPLREFLHVDDCADGCIHIMTRFKGDGPVNLGSGEEISIGEVVAMLCEIAGFKGQIVADQSKPDGARRRLMDSGLLQTSGWRPSIALRDGLAQTYYWFASQYESGNFR